MHSRNTKHLNNICILHMRKCTIRAHTPIQITRSQMALLCIKKYEVGWLVGYGGFVHFGTFIHSSVKFKQKKKVFKMQIFLKWIKQTTSIYFQGTIHRSYSMVLPISVTRGDRGLQSLSLFRKRGDNHVHIFTPSSNCSASYRDMVY